MKKITAFVLSALLLFSLLGCATDTPPATTSPTTTKPSTSQSSLTSNAETLFVNIDGQTYTYIRHSYGDSSLTKKDLLKRYIISANAGTFIEGIVCLVYSTEEYPDFSYVLHISTGGTWTYQLIDKQ